MNSSCWKPLAVLFVIAAILGVYLSGKLFVAHLHAARAHTQIMLFYEEKEKALASGQAQTIAGCIRKVSQLSPITPDVRSASHMQQAVEIVRSNVIKELVSHLEYLTGMDLENDPKAWLHIFEIEYDSTPP